MGRLLAGRRLLSVALLAGVLALPGGLVALGRSAEAGTGQTVAAAKEPPAADGPGRLQEHRFTSAALGRAMP